MLGFNTYNVCITITSYDPELYPISHSAIKTHVTSTKACSNFRTRKRSVVCSISAETTIVISFIRVPNPTAQHKVAILMSDADNCRLCLQIIYDNKAAPSVVSVSSSQLPIRGLCGGRKVGYRMISRDRPVKFIGEGIDEVGDWE